MKRLLFFPDVLDGGRMSRGSAYFWELDRSSWIEDGIRSAHDSVHQLHRVVGFRLIEART